MLTGFHSASLRHTFTSVSLSPPAAHNLLAVRSHFGCVHLAAANCSCRTSISQSIAKVHLHSSAAFVPCGKFTLAASYGAGIGLLRRPLLPAPHGGSQARPVVPPSRALRRLASNATVRTSVPHSYASFLPQALLPAGLTQLPMPL